MEEYMETLSAQIDGSSASDISGFPARQDDFKRMIREKAITPFFQPIYDLYTGDIFGYEILSRGTAPFENPKLMFRLASAWDVSWELEYTCRMNALEKIASLPEAFDQKYFFINVSPHIFNNPLFSRGFSRKELREIGIDYKNIVIEITEASTVGDYKGFEDLIRHYVEQGFYVALDDFGAGHSGLITLVAMTPHYLKLDRGIISDIHLNTYKQNLVKAISSFSSSVEIYLIAEGIEKYEELRTAFRQGVRFGQGFLLGKPLPYPVIHTRETKELLHDLIEDYNLSRFAVDISISKLVARPFTVESRTMTCADLDREFRRNNSMDHVVVLDEGVPSSLITRQDFYSAIGGRYGFSFFEKRLIDSILTPNMLVVEEQTDLRTLGKFAMNRNHNELYNPVVIIDKTGTFIGTITIKQLLTKAFDMEIKIASYSNPLTELPGNIIIGVWLDEVLAKPKFTVIYGDLNNFKEYNDTYGFARGDDMIKLTAKVLQKHFAPLGSDVRIGHIGGDDFIVIYDDIIPEYALEDVCRDFDDQKGDFFSSAHITKGFYYAANRQGDEVKTPLVSLSLAVVTEKNFDGSPHPARLSEIAAHLKKKIKSVNREHPKSDYLEERRIYEL